jgi:hypothetical protein
MRAVSVPPTVEGCWTQINLFGAAYGALRYGVAIEPIALATLTRDGHVGEGFRTMCTSNRVEGMRIPLSPCRGPATCWAWCSYGSG